MAEHDYCDCAIQGEERLVCRGILNNILDIVDKFSLPFAISFSKEEVSNLYAVSITYSGYDAKCIEWIFERAEYLYDRFNNNISDGEE